MAEWMTSACVCDFPLCIFHWSNPTESLWGAAVLGGAAIRRNPFFSIDCVWKKKRSIRLLSHICASCSSVFPARRSHTTLLLSGRFSLLALLVVTSAVFGRLTDDLVGPCCKYAKKRFRPVFTRQEFITGQKLLEVELGFLKLRPKILHTNHRRILFLQLSIQKKKKKSTHLTTLQ